MSSLPAARDIIAAPHSVVLSSGLPVIGPQKRNRLGQTEPFYARLWGSKMRRDEERLQRNHYAIRDVFMKVGEDGPNRTLSPRADVPDYQDVCASSINAGARLDARGVKIEWYRVDIPGIKRLRRSPDMDLPVIRLHSDGEVVTVR